MRSTFWGFALLFLIGASLDARPRTYPPCVYAFDLPKLPNGEIAYINGINHRPERAIRCALLLAKRAGLYNIYTIYSPTEGLLGDLKECYHELYRFKKSPPVEKLHERWNAFFAHAHPKATYLQFCHSRGTIQVRNALLTYPEEIRKRIVVVAIAPAAYIPKQICHTAYHYVSRRDIVPYFDWNGRKACQSTLIVLTPHFEAPFFDHHFLSPTYRAAIEHHLATYIQERVSILDVDVNDREELYQCPSIEQSSVDLP